MSSTELMLIDLSGLAHQAWHTDTQNPDPSSVSTAVIARVRALASQHLHAAVCCDSGKSFRADIDPAYKAQRDTENRAPLRHQMDVACETLQRDGFPVWRVPGMEADDIIATATRQALAISGTQVLIVSSDKDLLQLVNDRVRVKSIITDGIAGPAKVFDKFGVKPSQMGDLLALMGDTSDNIKGAEKIGKTIGARLLCEHGSLSAIYEKLQHGVVSGVTAGMRTSLMEFKARWPTVARLVALRDDVEIPFHEIATERTAPAMAEEAEMSEPMGPDSFGGEDAPHAPAAETLRRELSDDAAQAAAGRALQAAAERVTSASQAAERVKRAEANGADVSPVDRQTAMTVAGPLPPAVYAPVDFSQQLEPRNMDDAVRLAQRMFESRLFGAYGTPQAVLATVLAGRELGIPAMASLRAFHVIEGKPTMSAGTIQSLVIKSGKATYFRCVERTNERATFETQRGDDPPVSLSFSVEDGRRAWPKDDLAFAKSGWGRNPADMCVARASSKLARLVYPDVVSGLYAPEEMD